MNKIHNKKIRIANILEEGRYGGPQNRVLNVAAKLSDEFHTIIFMPRKNSNYFQKCCQRKDIEFKKIPITRASKGIVNLAKYFLFFIFEILILAWYLRTLKIDLVHASGGAWQIKGIIASKLALKRCIWHINDSQMPLIICLFMGILSTLPDCFIFSAKRSQKFYKRYIIFNKPEFIILPPVDTKVFKPSKEIVKKRNRVFESNSNLFIGTVANISPVKGIEMLIECASILNKNYNNLQFFVVGKIFDNQISYYEELLELCKIKDVSNFEFVGEKKNIVSVLGELDIFTITSIAESGPISLWEAMSMGKPVISTDVGDVSQFIINGENGFIVESADPQSFAKSLEALINDRTLREYFSKRSRKIATQKLDISICARKHERVYKKMTQNI